MERTGERTHERALPRRFLRAGRGQGAQTPPPRPAPPPPLSSSATKSLTDADHFGMIRTAQRRFAPTVIGITRNSDRHQIGMSDRHRRNTQISPFQHAQEELLREILRLIGRITAPAQIGIQRIPVVLTQINQSRPGFLAMWITGSDHQGPPRRRKLGWSGQRVHGLAVRHGLILTGIPLNRIRKSSAKVTPPLWSSGGLCLSLLDDRNIGIGILPDGEEVLITGG